MSSLDECEVRGQRERRERRVAHPSLDLSVATADSPDGARNEGHVFIVWGVTEVSS